MVTNPFPFYNRYYLYAYDLSKPIEKFSETGNFYNNPELHYINRADINKSIPYENVFSVYPHEYFRKHNSYENLKHLNIDCKLTIAGEFSEYNAESLVDTLVNLKLYEVGLIVFRGFCTDDPIYFLHGFKRYLKDLAFRVGYLQVYIGHPYISYYNKHIDILRSYEELRIQSYYKEKDPSYYSFFVHDENDFLEKLGCRVYVLGIGPHCDSVRYNFKNKRLAKYVY